MKIAVMGAGGVGGYFGGRLANAGNDVTFIARGDHLRAIQASGLKVESPLGSFVAASAHATDDAAAIGPVDYVFFTVKLYDTAAAAERVKPLLGENTAVITFQNGVDSVDILSGVLGRRHVMGGVAHIAAVIDPPGTIRHTGRMARLTFGELDGRDSDRARRLKAACDAAGIEAVVSTAIERDIWAKFVFLAPFAAITSLTRRPIGPIRQDAETRALFRAALAEAFAVAQARGAGLAGDTVDKLLAFADGLDPAMKSSMLGDLERGKRLELHHLSGAVVRLGRESGVATPVHAFVVAALKLHAEGAA